MIMRILKLVILIPVALVLILLSVANRHAATLALNPFEPADQALSLTLPFFIFLLIAVMIGVVIGSFATWYAQGRHRKRARDEAFEARKWREEADRQRGRVEDMTTQKLISASR
ncbi:LapA family protein [Rhizobium sp. TRM95796]|jgi:NADH:ubiquinone oxidoreductase subunit 3 (subunit A)|uniref:LapA family protein n=1 Tax=Rhizobium sp. TRM95796 TaxID=2979862 RepID=UPI0021E85C34|nr:LapA family protein [Rhizobium sp. TRM95796]MCV3767167.1 DUF1049 domain-containing protein [Rhizobium sp. TRM95796]